MDFAGLAALITACGLCVATVLGALASFRGSVRQLQAATEVVTVKLAAKTDEVAGVLADKAAVQAQATNEKLAEIHDLTNSNLTTVKEALTAANEKIARLEEVVANMAARKGDGDPVRVQIHQPAGDPVPVILPAEEPR